jgi:hypothetical protein
MCDFLGWFGVRFGLLKPETPALASLGSFLLVLSILPILSEYFSDGAVLVQANYESIFDLSRIEPVVSPELS